MMVLHRLYILTIEVCIGIGVVEGTRPNIIFLLGDDIGFGDIGYVDGNILSPNMDTLALSGIRLGRQYSYAWCAPSRSALLSGRYPVYNGVYGGASGPNFALSEDFELLPAMMKQAGYATHAVGKWHLGMYEERFLPERRGFDSFFGFLNGGEDHFLHSGSVLSCHATYTDLWDSEKGGPAANESYFPLYSTYLYGDKAVKVIQNHDPVKPLFLYVAFQSAHSPFQVPHEYVARYPDSEERCPWSSYKDRAGFPCTGPAGSPGKACFCGRLVISAMVTALDDAVGRIKQALQDKQMWNNTLVVFSGDNGGPQEEGHWNGGLRGGKWTNFEGGIRPAAFVHAEFLPPHLQGTWNNATLHLVDWMPTFLHLAGVTSLPDSIMLDGYDQWPTLVSPGAQANPRNYTLVTKGILIAEQYKLITVPPMGDVGAFPPKTVPWQGWECLLGTDGGWTQLPNSSKNECPTVHCENVTTDVDHWLCSGACNVTHPCLFDVVVDPQERNNLAASNPYIVNELYAVLQAYDDQIIPKYQPVKSVNNSMCLAFQNQWGGYLGPWYNNSASDMFSKDVYV